MSTNASQSNKPTEGLPPGFSLKKLANFGTSEPWVARVQLGITDLSMIAFPTSEAHKEFTDAWLHAGMKLGEAFSTLVDLRRLNTDPETPLLDLSRTYNSFYSLLWAAYKDRWQTAMKLLNFDMTFLFVSERNFEAKFAEFASAHPTLNAEELKALAIADRSGWQNRLGEYRNQEIEHRTGNQQVEFFENPQSAEASFSNVWRAMEDWVIIALSQYLKPPMRLIAIPKGERDPTAPKKYKLGFDMSVTNQPDKEATS